MNVVLGTMIINKFIKKIFPMERPVMRVHSGAMAILASNSTLPPIITSVSNDAEPAATGDYKEPLNAQMGVQANYTVHVVNTKTVPHPQ